MSIQFLFISIFLSPLSLVASLLLFLSPLNFSLLFSFFHYLPSLLLLPLFLQFSSFVFISHYLPSLLLYLFSFHFPLLFSFLIIYHPYCYSSFPSISLSSFHFSLYTVSFIIFPSFSPLLYLLL